MDWNIRSGTKRIRLKDKQTKIVGSKEPCNLMLLAFDYIKSILKDDMGMLWIGFWGAGLARLNPESGNIEYWRNEENKPTSLSYNDVWVIYQDLKGRIWIGTNGGGLDLFDEIMKTLSIIGKLTKNISRV